MFLETTVYSFDYQRILDTLDMLEHYHDNDQIMLNTRHMPSGSGIEYILDGTGGLATPDDFQWDRVLPIFKDTYIEQVYNEVCELYKVGRARAMRMQPGKCYTLHSDYTKRFHIPLKTNSDVVFFDGKLDNYKMPEVGRGYILDTTQTHTAANFSNEERVHLVFAIND